MTPKILSYCKIENGVLQVNGELVHQSNSSDLDDFLLDLFKALEISYPKFYKMDNLSKLAFLGVESLIKNETQSFRDDEIAQCFINSDSSLDSDVKHQQMINEQNNVSPSVFVYTLPNILMGEIAIRHKWYGENLFILAPQFDVDEWLAEAALLFKLNKANFCIGGWVNCLNNSYQLKLIFAAKNGHNNIDIARLKEDFKK